MVNVAEQLQSLRLDGIPQAWQQENIPDMPHLKYLVLEGEEGITTGLLSMVSENMLPPLFLIFLRELELTVHVRRSNAARALGPYP